MAAAGYDYSSPLTAAGDVRWAAVALRPEAPDAFIVAAPPDPKSLRDAVDQDLAGLFLVLAAGSLVVGTFGIANTTLVSSWNGWKKSVCAERSGASAITSPPISLWKAASSVDSVACSAPASASWRL